MKIILSPDKQMNVDTDTLEPLGLSVFIDKSEEILSFLKGKSYEELKNLWACNDKIAMQNFERLKNMNLRKNL
ncbi:hypothetical protein SAMN05216249_106153 [Acetitomaculum ruminis DSM 5522]|uniref:Uncharacterized protein n=1 Tax=Acetitomaculum ruminis DSM 5522 TaxID=1120918 RepID=A0A1I0XI15_9FIRM|nr:peroxide stress protein YaaA [Acetitomaculum ruminis]SFB00066.1 hypothetical protein SAMN05216249_106153 [Acetitomaculum ruminis DSM 5522]